MQRMIVCDITDLEIPALLRNRVKDQGGMCFCREAFAEELISRGAQADPKLLDWKDLKGLPEGTKVIFCFQPDEGAVLYKELSVSEVIHGVLA